MTLFIHKQAKQNKQKKKNGGYAFHDAHLVYCLRSLQRRTTSMGLSWTAYSEVSHLLAGRLALVRLWCLGFFSLDVSRYQATPVRGSLRSPSTWRRMCFGWFPLPGLPGYLLCRIFSQLASPLTFQAPVPKLIDLR